MTYLLSEKTAWIQTAVGAARYWLARIHPRSVPVLLQLSNTECGAACLAMILSYHGRKTRVAECREQCGVGRDGLTAATIANAGRYYGLRVKAYSVKPADFKYIPLPAVAHWNFNHFVVVERWSAHRVTIVDPAAGRRRLSGEAFAASFTGVVLTFMPGVQFKNGLVVQSSSPIDYLRAMLQTPGTTAILVQILATSLLLQLFGLGFPLITQILIDRILPFQIHDVMTILGIGMLLMALTQMIVIYLRGRLFISLRTLLDARMMARFFEHVLALPFPFFQQRTSGDLIMRLGSHSTIREALTGQTMSIILDSAFIVMYLAIILVRAPSFGLLVLGLGILQMALLMGTSRQVHALTQQSLDAQAKSQSYLVEALRGIATLKTSGAETQALDQWSDLFFGQLSIALRQSQLSNIVNTLMATLRTLSPLILLWVGAQWVLSGNLTLGTMLALNVLASSFLAPLTSLAATGQQLQLVGAHLDRIIDVLEAEPEQNVAMLRPSPNLSGRIQLEQVSFRYDPHAPLVLHDVSIAIKPGQKVALVGATGSGKSTLAMLLLGLYSPTAGQIYYDDIPLAHLNYQTVRRQFGVVLQESFLFSGSIRKNIAFNDPTLSLDQVMEAARLAGIHQEILQMPMGYETGVAEGGAALSGGQRQRLSIARALATNPTILLLDEATSHLDAVTEHRIDRNLDQLAFTRIVIAHRLSTIRNADLILVLSQGKLVEQGIHDQLVRQASHYTSLVNSQFVHV